MECPHDPTDPFDHDVNDDKCRKHGTDLYSACHKCVGEIQYLLAAVEKRAEAAEKVAKEAAVFERAATDEMNEKGAGGYALARLSDLRNALKEYRKEWKAGDPVLVQDSKANAWANGLIGVVYDPPRNGLEQVNVAVPWKGSSVVLCLEESEVKEPSQKERTESHK